MRDSFLDSNVLLYFASGDPEKAGRVAELLTLGGVISVQVLNEVAVVCRRKFAYSWPEIAEVLAAIRRAFRVEPVTLAVHEGGLRIAESRKLAVFDAMLLSSALLAGCSTFWSEDMHDGLVLDGRLTIRNPFA